MTTSKPGPSPSTPTTATHRRLQQLLGPATTPLLFQTPLVVTPDVLRALATVRPEPTPFFVRVQPEPWCQPRQCFQNAYLQQQRKGGKIVLGYAIRVFPRIAAELQEHAIWIDDDRGPVDLTPRDPCDEAPSDQERLFLPVPASELRQTQQESLLTTLGPGPEVQAFAQVKRRILLWNNKGAPDLGRSLEAQMQQSYAQALDALNWSPEPSDPCPCGSRRIYADCHGR